MKLSTMALATAACAAVALFPTAAWPQWGSPARYNHQGLNDRSEAVAVDVRGNMYVAGTVATTADDGDFDVVVHSYTAAGVARSGWPKTYNGAADGDDYAASIAVDGDCNVYVAGTSWGDSTDYDFFVWKLDTNGDRVWPNSGSYAGYNFDSLGAVRTNTTTNEGFTSGFSPEHLGVKVDMAVRQSTNPEHRTIAVTGTGKNAPGGSATRWWHTVVFEQNSTGTSVSLKSGWPVTWPSDSTRNAIPEAVAIHSDNSVYVTGLTYNGDGTLQQFTTIRYKAVGGSGSGGSSNIGSGAGHVKVGDRPNGDLAETYIDAGFRRKIQKYAIRSAIAHLKGEGPRYDWETYNCATWATHVIMLAADESKQDDFLDTHPLPDWRRKMMITPREVFNAF